MKHIKNPLLAIFLLTSIMTLSFAQFANLSFGAIDEGAQTIEILMTNDTPVAGVQFNTSGATFSFASGGSSADNNWMVSVGGSGTVIGFTFGMAYIPATDVPVPLMYLHYTALSGLPEDVTLSAGVVSGPPGQPALTVTYGPCDDPISTYLTETCGGGPGCIDTAACNYDPAATSDDGSCTYDDGTGTCCLPAELDECGVCNGPGILPGECDCAGNVEDCLGVCGGTAVLDECGVCDGPGILPGECDCDGNVLDCAGVCGGTAVEDNCGTCDSDPGNDCVQDCNGDWGGTAVLDECGVCDGPGILPGECDCDGNVLDCAGVCGGTAVEDNCGTCDSDPGNDCVQDCNGDWGGTAVLDECGVCDGPGLNADGCCGTEVPDCAGVCGGTSVVDVCGVCDGPGLNADGCCGTEVPDCAGVCGGTAVLDECGVCDGPGILPGECDCEGNVLDCAGVCGGTAVEDNCGTCDSDPENDCVADCNGVPGGDAVEDMCGVCDNDPTNDCVQDCNGDWGGTAVLDECGVCDGPGILPGECDCEGNVEDCAGVCGGTAVIDECGVCDGPGILPGECDCEGNVEDCAGVCGGTAVIDECGVCDGPGILPGECDCEGNVLDCAGVCGGTAVEDNCGTCDSDPENDCVADCNGVPGGDAVEDMCGVCDNDPTNDCVQDCNGDWGGTAVIDECGVCDGPGAIYDCGCEDIPEGACDCEGNVEDCAGVCGGTAVIDECGVCDGPGLNADGCCGEDIPDCLGVCGGDAVIDECGVCDGPGAIYDCGCEDIPDGFCDCEGNVEDCAGICGGDTIVDICGECDGDGSTCTGCMDETATNFDPSALIACDGCCAYEPFLFDQSTQQAFYFIEAATIEEVDAEPGADWIGVFNGDICVGGFVWEGPFTAIPAMGDDGDPAHAGYMMDGDIPTFQIYDASTGEYREAFADGVTPGLEWYNLAFISIDLLHVDAQYTQALELHTGSNLVSFYVLPPDPSLQATMAPVYDNALGVIGEGSAAQPHPVNYGEWIGSLTDFAPESGYWMNVNADVVLEITGYAVPELTYGLHSGANLVSYPFMDVRNIADAIPAELVPFVTGVIGEGVAAIQHPAFPGTWIGSLTQFVPGAGYWLLLNDAVSYYWGAPALAKADIQVEAPAPVPAEFAYRQSENQAFYFVDDVKVNGLNITPGDWIIAYNGNVVVGARLWNGSAVDIPVMGSSSMETIGYCENGDIPSFKVLSSETGELIALEGNAEPFSANAIYTLGTLTNGVEIPTSFDVFPAYPNPFNPSATVSYSLAASDVVEVNVFDMTGKIVATLVNELQPQGYHEVIWDATGNSSGVYLVKVTVGDETKIQKVMLLK